ncbi:MAG TPA: glycosyl hydrolase 115 family protein, partial [Balneolaceae bacterium]|nr:glycosyl hydrolase 115 family protein [Balneolaceae bacterium]
MKIFKFKRAWLLVLFIVSPAAIRAQQKVPVDYVKTHIGGGSHRLTTSGLGGALPPGYPQLAPNLTPGIKDSYLGSKIYGYPAGSASFRPTTGSVKTKPDNIALSFKNGMAQSRKAHSGFVLSAPHHATNIVVGQDEKEVVHIAAHALAGDIKAVTGKKPLLKTSARSLKGSVVVIGTVGDPLVQRLLKKYDLPDIKGKWEHFLIRVLPDKRYPSQKILLIAGSDPRGAAYGAFTISRLIGVSPWKWWADATPAQKRKLTINSDINIEQGPSVKYRGIFLNDEDWGLRPWAKKTFEPRLGKIGPKTYAKIFELLLRLKANTIWPAMHPGTTPFFNVKGNEKMARKYDIVIGTAHNEPMMRDNNEEWHSKTMGPFNYLTNRDSVYNYWKQRVKQVAGDHNIYTLGMRGVGDSGMKGASTLSQKVALLSRLIKDQRGLLKKYVNPDLSQVPQVFIPYKEVLPVYDHGLKVPDDVTLMWPDDNYGYIRRLSDKSERQRSGGSGIYYHLSYWGSPHDYLWLSTTQPGLVWEEMQKAWNYDARRMWIANVGDIKPAEYNIQFFLNMAWNIHDIKPGNILQHMRQWSASIFGRQNAKAITKVKDQYYRLAMIRRPEFMGWSQVYPQTPTKNTAFRPFFDGDEIARRLNAYKRLIRKVEQIKKNIPDDRRNAYFELVRYPVEGAAYMNEKFLYAQKSRL